MQVRIKNGLDLKISADPGGSIEDSKSLSTSSILGCDYPGSKFQILADEGTSVKAGQAVLCDRRRAEILLTAPFSGKVSAIHRGPRRSLVSFQLSIDGREDAISFDIPSVLDSNSIKELMLKSGLWPALRTRPFGYIPNPDESPKALLITAIDTLPLAPDPAVVISKYSKEFSTGLRLLCDLVDSPVYLCQSAGQRLDYDDSTRARVVEFGGPHPSGLVGTHINLLCPLRFDGNQVWHIGYQDVISLGHLIASGKPWFERVISLAGPAVKTPRLITVPLGASLAEIVEGEVADQPAQIISGSVLSSRQISARETVLGRFDQQVTAVFDSSQAPPESWLGSLFEAAPGKAVPLIATPDLDTVAPPGILAVPFLRALLVGDVERARDLGALELVEEDLALLSYICPSKIDYRPLLRDMLNQIDREGLSIRN